MSAPKVHPSDYIDFLIATPKACSGTEAARVQPDQPDPPAHDAFTRLLTRLEPDPDTLWAEAETQVRRDDGVLVVDDSTLDKPYARSIELVSRHWSGKHHAVVPGINLVSLLWPHGDRGDGYGGLVAGLRSGQGIRDCHPKRWHRVLGHQRPVDDGPDPRAVRGLQLGDRALPPGDQAMHRDRAVPVPLGPRAAEPH